jgi:hypothetical protein
VNEIVPDSIPLNVALMAGAALFSWAGTWFGLRGRVKQNTSEIVRIENAHRNDTKEVLRRARAESEEAKRQAEAAHRRIDERERDHNELSREVSSIGARVDSMGSSMDNRLDGIERGISEIRVLLVDHIGKRDSA